jgi:hypothetical protein
MKKKILSLSLVCLVAGSLFFTGCKKDSDSTGPVITLNGDSEVKSVLNQPYTDLGATAKDDTDGDVTVTTDAADVNKDLTGTYTVTYTATDKAGNTSTATRTVRVYNTAEVFAGSYTVKDYSPSTSSTPSTYNETITASSTLNNKLHTTKFGFYTGVAAELMIGGTATAPTITVPAQTFTNVGAPPNNADRRFSDAGGNTIATSPNIVLTINYKEEVMDTNGNVTSTIYAKGVYTKN